MSRGNQTDFPIVCETCLGPNPYVRMMKAEYDKECKICTRPFTVFRWKPGPNARYKKTEICQTCAKIKNVCQTCLLDLEWGLPVQVRDAVTGNSDNGIPQSDVNREWYTDQAEKGFQLGLVQNGKTEVRGTLQKIARNNPYYKRNESHICSFFLKGECKRGAECPYRHEIPEKNELSSQNLKDRYLGVNDPVARKMMGKLNAQGITPPENKDIKTLWVGNVDSTITESELKSAFLTYGEISEIKLVPKSLCAFVSFYSRESAEKAAEKLHNNLSINGAQLRLAWSKPQAFDVGKGPVAQPPPSNSYFNIPSQPTSTGGSSYFSLPPPTSFVPPPLPGTSKLIYPSMNSQQFGSKTDR